MSGPGPAKGARVAVLGGGVIGTANAYCLAEAGFEVVLIEAREGLGLETSFANGGLITPSMADPWASPGLPLKLLKWIGREDSPFLIRPRALPGMLGWGLAFLRNCTEQAWRRNTETIFRACAHSQRELDRVTEAAGLRYDRGTSGTLRLLRDEAALAAALEIATLVGELGVEYRVLDTEACIALEPALADQRDQIRGGVHYPGDDFGDAHLFTTALGDRCAELGVELRFGERVTGFALERGRIAAVETDKGRVAADAVVLALGVESLALARQLGLRLPIYPVKGYSMTLDAAGWNRQPRIPVIDDARKMGIAPLGDRIRLAGTAEFAGFDKSLNETRNGALLSNFMALFPDFPNAASAEPWAGLRPMTPDGIPVLGPTPIDNLFLNVGHGHLGWTLACGSARVVTDLVAGRPPEIDIADMTLAGRR